MSASLEKGKDAAQARLWMNILAGIAIGAAGLALGYLWRGKKDDPPIAVVNGVKIDYMQFAHRCIVAAGPKTLNDMVNEELTVDLARNLGVLPTDAQVQARYDQAAQKPDFAKQLYAAGRTPADYRRQVYVELCQQGFLTRGVTVTDADVRAFYQANTNPKDPQARYYQPDTVQIEVIVTTNPADHSAALAALASGQSFAAVAQQYSKDPSAANGGVLSPIRKGSLGPKAPPGFEADVFRLQVGQQIDNFPAGKTTWIIRCIGRKPGFLVPFDQVKEECRDGAAIAKGLQTNGATLQAEKAAITKSATITVFWPSQRDVSLAH